MKRIKMILKKLRNSSSYCSMSSKSTTADDTCDAAAKSGDGDGEEAVVFVGSSRRRYMINSKHLNHPVMTALIDRSELNSGDKISVRCEVVLFDHLLWMLDNADPKVDADDGTLQELAELYVY
ncbi:auxin-responsive protein SAUR77-like [Typha latifolia]|uniref:auxin-responsive protein SAUR77-like n=1 Tax=Typha latifolia TaxID=4733 RepID=UPI003C2E03B7